MASFLSEKWILLHGAVAHAAVTAASGSHTHTASGGTSARADIAADTAFAGGRSVRVVCSVVSGSGPVGAAVTGEVIDPVLHAVDQIAGCIADIVNSIVDIVAERSVIAVPIVCSLCSRFVQTVPQRIVVGGIGTALIKDPGFPIGGAGSGHISGTAGIIVDIILGTAGPCETQESQRQPQDQTFPEAFSKMVLFHNSLISTSLVFFDASL